jgi:uncharacterized membrane protein
MDGTRLLLAVVLVVGAIMAVTAAIQAAAPYLAMIIVLGAVCVLIMSKEDPGE